LGQQNEIFLDVLILSVWRHSDPPQTEPAPNYKANSASYFGCACRHNHAKKHILLNYQLILWNLSILADPVTS